jgi:hypothetical protein
MAGKERGTMSLLFTQHWDILCGKEDEYSAFVSRKFIPMCNELGLTSVGGYYVEVGVGPRIIAVQRVESLDELSRVMATQTFKDLIRELKEYVEAYRSKILQPTGKAKNAPYTIQRGVWKYLQYWDVMPRKRKQYADFMVNTYVPTVEKIKYLELTGGWNVLIGGFSEIIGELTFKDPVDIGSLLNNGDFRDITHVLRTQFVSNYSSRILRTTERFDEPKWFTL